MPAVPGDGSEGSDAHPWRYFVIATAFNASRILALGVAIGFVAGRNTREAKS
jgi:hypothetical protein